MVESHPQWDFQDDEDEDETKDADADSESNLSSDDEMSDDYWTALHWLQWLHCWAVASWQHIGKFSSCQEIFVQNYKIWGRKSPFLGILEQNWNFWASMVNLVCPKFAELSVRKLQLLFSPRLFTHDAADVWLGGLLQIVWLWHNVIQMQRAIWWV